MAQNSGRISINIGTTAFKNFVFGKLNEPDYGINNYSICDLYNHVIECFASILQTKIDANHTKLYLPMNPIVTIAIYTQKQ